MSELFEDESLPRISRFNELVVDDGNAGNNCRASRHSRLESETDVNCWDC